MSRIIIEKDIEIPMRDGCVLKADLYRPEGPEKLPVLLNRTPYDKSFPPITLNTLDVVRAARAGYNVVVQDCRGLFASQGTFRCFVDEARDGYDTIEFIARQPWADGKVGTFGASYMGATQWLAATQRPPSLKAMVPSITASDYHDGWVYQGGAFELFFSVSWLMITLGLSRLMRERAGNPKAAEELSALMGSIDVMRERMEFAPLSEFPLFRTGAPYFFDWLAHPYYDDYWRAICIEEQHDKIDVPALNVGGWHDIFMGGTLRNYLGMRARGASAGARAGQRLLVGPWHHAVPFSSLVGQVDYGFRSGPVAIDYDGTQLRWFDHWLKGVDNGVDKDVPVRLFVMGVNQWREHQEWPPPERRDAPLLPAQPRQGQQRLWRRRAREPRRRATSRRIRSSTIRSTRCRPPAAGCAATPTRRWAGRSTRAWSSIAPTCWSTRASRWSEDLEVIGPVTVTLYASSSAPDTDFTAKLVDAGPCGFARNLTDGIIRARVRESRSEPKLMVAGKVYEFKIDLWATANVFKAGHRVRLEISSSNFPRFDRNPNTGHELFTDAEMRPALQSVMHERSFASYLSLPVMPRRP